MVRNFPYEIQFGKQDVRVKLFEIIAAATNDFAMYHCVSIYVYHTKCNLTSQINSIF